MNKSIKLADIAKKSKVSLSTVSLVLRDKPGIPPETRRRVLEAAQSLGYRPKPRGGKASHHVRSAGRLYNLGLIVKSEPHEVPQANPFYSLVMAGIEEACRQKKINLLYAMLEVDEDNVPLETPRLLAEDHVDGLLLVGAFVDETLAHVLRERPLPVVLVDAYSARNAYDAVVSDNFRGAYEAVTHLIDCGHRHIGLVGSHLLAYPSFRERRQGYLQALRDHDIEDSYFADSTQDIQDVTRATSTLLRDHPSLSALFGCNDHAALAAMRAAQALGRCVPQDLSLVGFDDIDLAQHVQPLLTTMHVDKIGMGRVAVQLLLNRIEFPDSERVTSVISPRLITRNSVAPPA
jgi:LacI family transcriptional regulator